MSPDSRLRNSDTNQPGLGESRIVHVLFVDIVGFSTLNLTQQVPAIKRLEEVVQATSVFHLLATHDLIIRATGDGMALIFFTGNIVPAVECAREIAMALMCDVSSRSDVATIALRMGIHMGPVFKFPDINGELNVAGEGINTAQRVMDCGDAGHILISESVISQLRDGVWNTKLHDLGLISVKHGQEIHLFNLFDDKIGNALVPIKVKQIRAQESAARESRWSALGMLTGAAALLVVLLLIPFVPLPLVEAVSVAPFENKTKDSKVEALSKQLASRISQSLARSPKLVIDQNASNEKRRARWVLTGSISKDGDKLKLETELRDNVENRSIFTNTYFIDVDVIDLDHPFVGESRGVQEAKLAVVDLASNVLESLTPAESRPTKDATTYLEYLKGSEYLEFKTTKDLEMAKGYFTRASKLDPEFALGNIGLSQYHITVGGISEDPKIAEAEALVNVKEVFAKKSLNATTRARAYAVRGMIRFWFQRDWSCAKADFHEALAKDPTLTTAHRWYAMYLLVVNRPDEVKYQLDQASKQDPSDPLIKATLVQYYYFTHQNSAAKEEADRIIRTSNTPIAHRYLGLIFEDLADPARAESALKSAIRLTKDIDDMAALGHLYAISGRRDDAKKIIDDLHIRMGKEYVAPLPIALIYVGMWDKSITDKNESQAIEDQKRATEQLIAAAKGSDVRLSWLHLDPRFTKFFDAKQNHLLREMLWKEANLNQLNGNTPGTRLKEDSPAKCEEYSPVPAPLSRSSVGRYALRW